MANFLQCSSLLFCLVSTLLSYLAAYACIVVVTVHTKLPFLGVISLSYVSLLYLLKYNTMVPKINLKSTLKYEEEIHTKGRKLNIYSIYCVKQQ